MNTPSLGPSQFPSPLHHSVSEEIRIPQYIEHGKDPGVLFEPAGPRTRLFFDPKRVRAGIVTCGGLCPGLNNVIRSIFLELYYAYGVHQVYGFQGGYGGLDPETGKEPIWITTAFVDDIHLKGGTVLGTTRGPVDVSRAVDNLISRGINILFTVGGDGTQRGANELYEEAKRRGYALSVVGVPKTIDNDIAFVSRTFGFLSAVEESARVLACAHTEASSAPGGIGLVKLMGRHAGFITGAATVANQDVNVALIPEVPFTLEGLLALLKKRMEMKTHAVIAVAEGAGQELLEDGTSEKDASGNKKLKDIGVFLRQKIEAFFKAEGKSVVVRYFDPSYQVRSRPANAEDALLCDLFARHAVHAAMAGKTGVVIGYLHDRFIHVPIGLLAQYPKRLDTARGRWHSVLAATGQPPHF
jgi:6-phosphofructokinase 1